MPGILVLCGFIISQNWQICVSYLVDKELFYLRIIQMMFYQPHVALLLRQHSVLFLMSLNVVSKRVQTEVNKTSLSDNKVGRPEKILNLPKTKLRLGHCPVKQVMMKIFIVMFD